MSEIEKIFDTAMFNIYNCAREKCDYKAARFLQMLTEKGGLATAKHLLASDSPQEGLVHLWECGCLDLTVEALILQDCFQELFTDKERGEAKSRLEELGYF